MRVGLWESLLLFGLVALIVVPFWRIFRRVGHNGALSLLMLIPVANVIMLYVLAFGAWPVDRDARQSRRHAGHL